MALGFIRGCVRYVSREHMFKRVPCSWCLPNCGPPRGPLPKTARLYRSDTHTSLPSSTQVRYGRNSSLHRSELPKLLWYVGNPNFRTRGLGAPVRCLFCWSFRPYMGWGHVCIFLMGCLGHIWVYHMGSGKNISTDQCCVCVCVCLCVHAYIYVFMSKET